MITTSELSELSGYSTATIRALARDGLIPAVADEMGRWLFGEDAAEQLASMAERAEDGSDELQDELEAMYEGYEDDDDIYDDEDE